MTTLIVNRPRNGIQYCETCSNGKFLEAANSVLTYLEYALHISCGRPRNTLQSRIVISVVFVVLVRSNHSQPGLDDWYVNDWFPTLQETRSRYILETLHVHKARSQVHAVVQQIQHRSLRILMFETSILKHFISKTSNSAAIATFGHTPVQYASTSRTRLSLRSISTISYVTLESSLLSPPTLTPSHKTTFQFPPITDAWERKTGLRERGGGVKRHCQCHLTRPPLSQFATMPPPMPYSATCTRMLLFKKRMTQ